jgi:hypothetical protein
MIQGLIKNIDKDLVQLIGMLLSISLAVVFYIRSRRSRRISFICVEKRLIGHGEQDLPAAVQITFNGKKIRQLNRIRVIFWNSGTETILGNEIVSDDKFRFQSIGNSILEGHVIKSNRDVNNITCHVEIENKNIAIINFEYLDKKDGGIVDFLIEKTDDASSGLSGKILGTIRGIPAGLHDLSKSKPSSNLTRIGGIIAAIYGVSLVFYFYSNITDFSSEKSWAEISIVGIISFIALIFGISLLYVSYYFTIDPRPRFPKELGSNEFYD